MFGLFEKKEARQDKDERFIRSFDNADVFLKNDGKVIRQENGKSLPNYLAVVSHDNGEFTLRFLNYFIAFDFGVVFINNYEYAVNIINKFDGDIAVVPEEPQPTVYYIHTEEPNSFYIVEHKKAHQFAPVVEQQRKETFKTKNDCKKFIDKLVAEDNIRVSKSKELAEYRAANKPERYP